MSQRFENLTAGATGYAHAPAVVLVQEEDTSFEPSIAKDAVPQELARFEKARHIMRRELEDVIESAKKNLSAEHAEIFEGHLALFEDDEFQSAITEKIKSKLYSAEHAVQEFTDETCEEMRQLDEYFQERSQDFRDLGSRLIAVLRFGSSTNPIASLSQKSIVVAKELTPSMTAQMDVANVAGFITETGGPTSHVSFIAQNLEIPAIVGAEGVCRAIVSGASVLIDAVEGMVIVEPSDEEIRAMEERKKNYEARFKNLLLKSGEAAVTKDGKVVKVYANIGSVEDAKLAAKYGADGIGLFRTEFLFMGNAAPSLEEQRELYLNVFEIMKGTSVTVRTLDVGGDKKISYLNIGAEENPFLGFRGVRMYADHLAIIKDQLSALLLAGSEHAKRHGSEAWIKIMVPMLTSVREVAWFKKIAEQTAQELTAQGAFIAPYRIGIMVETPAAAILSNVLSHEVDFFSIGSNDLIQYVLAVDRGEKTVAHLYEPFHPAVLRLIHKTIYYANTAGIQVSMCGDMGGNPLAVPLLVAFGIDALSVGPANVPAVKDIVRQLHYADIKKAVEPLRDIGTQQEALDFARSFFEKQVGRPA